MSDPSSREQDDPDPGADSQGSERAPVLNYSRPGEARRRTGLVTIATFGDLWEANLAMGKLRAEGIEATLADANMVSVGGGFYDILTGGIKLQAPVADAERARLLLPSRGARRAVKCPRCGSTQTRLVPRHPVMGMLVLLLLGVPTILFGRRWACDACKNSWRRSIYEQDDLDDEPEDAAV